MLSDGGGAVVLEELEHAKARGARIYAELVGYSMTGDAHHITAPPEDGNGARRAMQLAMKDGGLNPSDVQYINAHATSTPLGDVAETIAIKGAFGDDARKIAVSATKSVTGHLLGAAGVVEAIFATLSIRDQIAPPTMNLHNPGEGCDLDYVPLTAAPHAHRRGALQLLRLRRHQRHAGAAPFHRLNAAESGAMRAPSLHVEPVELAPQALLNLSARWPERYPVLLDSAADGALSQMSLLAALPRGCLWLDSRGGVHTSGELPPLQARCLPAGAGRALAQGWRWRSATTGDAAIWRWLVCLPRL